MRHAPASRFVRDTEFFPDQRQLVLDLLKTSETLVACAADDANHVFGYIVFGPGDVVAWVFVKGPYRGMGLADELLQAAFPGRTGPLWAVQAGRMWGELEPGPIRGRPVVAGAMSRRNIFYRPHLLLRAS